MNNARLLITPELKHTEYSLWSRCIATFSHYLCLKSCSIQLNSFASVPSEMALGTPPMSMRLKQRAVIEFLTE